MTEFKNKIGRALTSQTAVLSVVLAAVTAAVFLSVCRCDFLILDDRYYVAGNPHIRPGLTLEGLKWALSAGLFPGTGDYVDYWQPVTVISRMLDMQLYGLNPAGHHLTNLMIHVLNVLLLFWILKKTTGAVYRSALAAAAFGIHPIQVEVVALVMGRKDVLGAFFGLLTLMAYIAYVRQPCLKRKLLVFLVFLMALMAKPMLVALPFALLILDYWPLGRTGDVPGREKWRLGARLVAEKVPLLILAIISSLITYRVRPAFLFHQPLSLRISNAVVFYITGLVKWIAPGNLSLWYPYPGADPGAPPFPVWLVAAAAGMIIVFFITAVFLSRKEPFFLAGWLWYLGAFVPAILLRPSDRYMYLPAVGLAVLTAWGIPALGGMLRVGRKALIAAAVFILLIWGVLAFIQAGYWKNSETLLRHSLAVVKNNFFIEHLLGQTLIQQGRYGEALRHYEEAVRIRPDRYAYRNDFGKVLLAMNRPAEAEKQFREAIRLSPGAFSPYSNLAALLKKEGRFGEAQLCLAQARCRILPGLLRDYRRDPNQSRVLYDLAHLLAQSGDAKQGVPYFEQFLKNNPYDIKMVLEYGRLLEGLGRFDDALALYVEAVKNNPYSESVRLKAGDLMARRGSYRTRAGEPAYGA